MSVVSPFGSENSESTSASLLRRIRSNDQTAWERMAALYSPLVYGWARRAGLGDSDAADIVQEVFVGVFRGIHDFQRDRGDTSFRAWLWAITRNQIRLFFRKLCNSAQAVGGSDANQRFQELPDYFDRDEISLQADLHQLQHRALDIIRQDFNETTWQAFWRMAVLHHSAAEIAADLELSENAVRQAKFRVLRRLQDELKDRFD